jgi:hypothetical protein
MTVVNVTSFTASLSHHWSFLKEQAMSVAGVVHSHLLPPAASASGSRSILGKSRCPMWRSGRAVTGRC